MLGLCGDHGKENETTIVYWGYIGIMEKKRETTIVYRGHIGVWGIGLLPTPHSKGSRIWFRV